MDWSKRKVSNKLEIKDYSINDIFIYYLQEQFYANRRYQRKLVWGIEEKRLLIDSILKKIPLPAILIAQYELPDCKEDIQEIVDGMQRLDAIISFMLGRFSIEYNGKYCYFDPKAYAETFTLLADNKIQEHTNVLPKEVCQEFYRYKIPIIITGKDDEFIELIFNRINSTGRKISSQDMRQSMSVGEFPDLVRRIASRVRRDFTYSDHINLSDMYKISVGSAKYGYGVDIDSVFWRRHDLITVSNMKESKDEELIETLLAMILIGQKFTKSKDSLDNLYKKGTALNNQIEDIISNKGKDDLEDKFAKVFDVIDMIFASVSSDFSSYLFPDRKKVSNKDECFKLLYMVIYRLLNEGYIAISYPEIADSIRKSSAILDQLTGMKRVDSECFENAEETLYRILVRSFAKEVSQTKGSFETELDKRLSYSRIELQMTEFKIGISDFSSNKINIQCIHNIARTLVAMANTDNTQEGLVIIGIADSRKSYLDWHETYREQPVIITFWVKQGIILSLSDKTGICRRKGAEVISPRLHTQKTVQPSYILDVPCRDLKSLYLRSGSHLHRRR